MMDLDYLARLRSVRWTFPRDCGDAGWRVVLPVVHRGIDRVKLPASRIARLQHSANVLRTNNPWINPTAAAPVA